MIIEVLVEHGNLKTVPYTESITKADDMKNVDLIETDICTDDNLLS